jgi:hypothetical protein
MKNYRRTVKDRDQALKDRSKLLAKRDRAVRDQADKAGKEEKKAAKRREKEELKAAEVGGHGRGPETTAQPHGKEGEDEDREERKKRKRDRKFCLLPSADAAGQRDGAWARVYMVGVDEVGAHCGLFLAGKPHYEGLVAGVGERVREWVAGIVPSGAD